MSKPNDTSPEAEQVLIEALRRMPLDQKWRKMGELYDLARSLHATGVRLRKPDARPEEIQRSWAGMTLGDELLREMDEARRGAEPG
jgi:hypothetical protein